MRTSDATKEGFVPRVGYKRTKQRFGKIFRWTSDPAGRAIKVLIGLIGDRAVGPDIVMRRNFTAQGAGKMAIYNQLISLVPWFPAYYKQARGVELTPDIIFDRYHKMYWENRQPKVSKEHYMHDKKLRPLLPAMDRLFLNGKIISEETARQLGSTNQKILL